MSKKKNKTEVALKNLKIKDGDILCVYVDTDFINENFDEIINFKNTISRAIDSTVPVIVLPNSVEVVSGDVESLKKMFESILKDLENE